MIGLAELRRSFFGGTCDHDVATFWNLVPANHDSIRGWAHVCFLCCCAVVTRLGSPCGNFVTLRHFVVESRGRERTACARVPSFLQPTRVLSWSCSQACGVASTRGVRGLQVDAKTMWQRGQDPRLCACDRACNTQQRSGRRWGGGGILEHPRRRWCCRFSPLVGGPHEPTQRGFRRFVCLGRRLLLGCLYSRSSCCCCLLLVARPSAAWQFQWNCRGLWRWQTNQTPAPLHGSVPVARPRQRRNKKLWEGRVL